MANSTRNPLEAQRTARAIPNGVVNLNLMLEASKALNRGMGAVPMADATPTAQPTPTPQAQPAQGPGPLMVYLGWLLLVAFMFGGFIALMWWVTQ